MTNEHLEAATASEQASEASTGACSPCNNKQGARIFRIITMIALPLLWIGFFYSLFTSNESNMGWYSALILMFSLLNADVLVKGEKLPNKALNVLAKANAVLLCAWAAAVIVHVLV